jgi:hypothetical protein
MGIKKHLTAILLLSVLIGCYDSSLINTKQSQEAPPVYKIAWPWDPDLTYAKGDAATMPEYDAQKGVIYESKKDGNKGIQPPSRIVIEGSIYGKVGDELPWIIPTPGWSDWWERIR